MSCNSSNATERGFSLVFVVAFGPDGTLLQRVLSSILFVPAACKVMSNAILSMSMLRYKAIRSTVSFRLMLLMAATDLIDGIKRFSGENITSSLGALSKFKRHSLKS